LQNPGFSGKELWTPFSLKAGLLQQDLSGTGT